MKGLFIIHEDIHQGRYKAQRLHVTHKVSQTHQFISLARHLIWY